MKRMLATILLLGVAGLGSACSTYVENEASLAFEPIYPAAHITPEGQAPTGGIFKENGGGLFASDIRARDVGDILTVSLNETFSATKAQTAASSKNDTFGVTLPTASLMICIQNIMACCKSALTMTPFNLKHLG